MLDRISHSTAPAADREIPRARTGEMCAALLTALWAFAAAPSAGAQDDEGPNANLFQLYDTQAARSRAAQAEEHITSARWAEAIAELQALIEDHAGEVLGGTRPRAAGAAKPSQQDVHPGAGAWAVGKLFALPADGRAFYRRRYAERAERALERAIAGGDRGALARIAQRWPITEAAPRAWWALGDLEVELGHTADGLRAWARAAAIGLDQPDRRCRSIEDWRALRADVEADEASPAGAAARLDFAIQILPEVGGAATSAHETEATFVLGPATGVAADAFGVRRTLTRPGDDAIAISGWANPYPLPYGPFREDAGCSRIFPQRYGDLVFINTSRSLHALNASINEAVLGLCKESHAQVTDEPVRLQSGTPHPLWRRPDLSDWADSLLYIEEEAKHKILAVYRQLDRDKDGLITPADFSPPEATDVEPRAERGRPVPHAPALAEAPIARCTPTARRRDSARELPRSRRSRSADSPASDGRLHRAPHRATGRRHRPGRPTIHRDKGTSGTTPRSHSSHPRGRQERDTGRATSRPDASEPQWWAAPR